MFKDQSTNHLGFTLIECLCILVIVSILFAAGIPSWKNNIANIQLDQESRDIVRYLALARTHAITRQTPIIVCFAPHKKACAPKSASAYQNKKKSTLALWIFVDNNENEQLDEKDTLIAKSVFSGSTFEYQWRSFRQQPTLQFLPTGATYDNGSLWIQDDQRLKKVIISRSGRTRIETKRINS